MSEVTTTEIVSEVVAIVQPTIEPPAPVAGSVEVRLTSQQLKERLDETRSAAERRVFAELGVSDLAKAKELMLKASPRSDDKWAQLEATTIAQQAKIVEMELLLTAVTNERAATILATLPEQARKAIEETTTDTKERITLAQVFAAAGVTVAAPAPQTVAATTAPPRSAPADASSSPPNRREEYNRLKQVNPVAAAHYLKWHSRDIFPG